MIKHYCDRCNVELTEPPQTQFRNTEWEVNGNIGKLNEAGQSSTAEVCPTCRNIILAHLFGLA